MLLELYSGCTSTIVTGYAYLDGKLFDFSSVLLASMKFNIKKNYAYLDKIKS